MGKIFRVTGPQTSFALIMKVPRIGAADSTELLLGFETESMILPIASNLIPTSVTSRPDTSPSICVTLIRCRSRRLRQKPAGRVFCSRRDAGGAREVPGLGTAPVMPPARRR